jgi:membrane protein implicated in regulation of membrane protease activity
VKGRLRPLRDLTLIVVTMGLVEVVFAGALIVAFEGDRVSARQMVATSFALGAAIALPLELVACLAVASVWAWRRFRDRGSRCRYCGDRVPRGLEACSVCDFFVKIRRAA